MSKVVLRGGLGEVVAMARSNLRNVPRPKRAHLRHLARQRATWWSLVSDEPR